MLQSLEGRARQLHQRLQAAYHRHPHIMATVVAATVTSMLALGVAGAVTFIDMTRDLPDRAAVGRIGEMDQATAVYDDQDTLAFTIFKEQRIDVPLDQVSPNLVHAILAIEDQRFYDHHGFDPIRIASAAMSNIRHRRVAQGGSTITQQLARQSFLAPEKTWRRKIQELVLAERIESQYTKPQILELYLNKVYFGDGLHGIEAASRGYFDKHASELTVSESAVLAGLVKSPSSYAPTVSMSRAVARRNIVLQAMLDHGDIDRATYAEARATKITLHDGLRASEPNGQYFKEEVRRQLVDRFGWPRVYQGGLRVYTTIDMPLQIAAEAAVAESMQALDQRRKALINRRAAQKKSAPVPDPEPLQTALLAIDPQTGRVRAMVGGRDFKDSTFNRAVQAHRQPGSAFKPFVYAAALESGLSPASIIDHLNDPIATPQGDWTPEDGHSTGDAMSLRTGLRISSNRAAVRLLQEVGIPRAVQYAKAMGVGDVPSVPSLALGSGDVTLASMTTAYASFANHGLVPQILLIRRVEDRDGHLLYEAHDSSTRAISDTTAFLMTTMLADVINAGTGSRARQLGFTLPAAGKTGTTNDFNDAWFIGYTPTLVAGVWVGFDQPRTILPNGFAADIAVPIWARFMKVATRGDKPAWFSPPPGITSAKVCRLSGQLATDGCESVEVDDNGTVERRSMVYTEYFASGTAPTASCDLHQTQSLFSKVASLFGERRPPPPPPRLEDTGIPTQPAAAPSPVGSVGQIEIPPPVAKKKPGFWSRFFGVRRSREADQSGAAVKPPAPKTTAPVDDRQ